MSPLLNIHETLCIRILNLCRKSTKLLFSLSHIHILNAVGIIIEIHRLSLLIPSVNQASVVIRKITDMDIDIGLYIKKEHFLPIRRDC